MKKSDITVMPEYFDRYINLVEDVDVITALEKYGIDFLKAEISKFEELADKVYAPAKWTAKDILQHIIDTERLFCYRALRFARQDKTHLPGADENMDAMHAKANDRELMDIVNEFNYTRLSTIALFKSFNNEMLQQDGTANNRKVSVLAIGFMIAGHFVHHLKVIEEKYYPLTM